MDYIDNIDQNLRKMMEEQVCLRIERLPPEDFLELYNKLMFQNVEIKKIVKVSQSRKIGEAEASLGGDIIREYREYLKASGNADSTIRGYLGAADKLKSFLQKEDIMVAGLKAKDVERYLAGEKGKGLQNNSYVKLVHSIRSFLKFLTRDYIDKEILEHIKAPRKTESIKEKLSELDIKRVEKYLGGRQEKYRNENLRDNLIFYLGIDCGLRRQEIINLNWEDVNLEEGSLKILNSKGGKSRPLYFGDKLKEILPRYRKLSQFYSGAVVRGFHGKRIGISSLQNLIDRIFEESEIKKEGLTLHSLRHTFAERHRKRGTDMKVISQLMGHSDLDTTATYFHVDNEDLKAAAL